MARPTLVVIGASLAGAKAVEAARDAGYDGRIVLIGDEPGTPYERPPLSKAVLRGEAEPDSTRVHPDGFYGDNDIELVTDHVAAIDTVTRRVELADGDTLPFDTAILATGAEPRRLTMPGAELDGVRYLRSVDDAVRLRDSIHASSRVAVIGAGWIGSEVAASARQMGADLVLVGIGVTPRTDVAAGTGLLIDDGIVVDEHLESGVAGIYAAGDVANAWHPYYRRHVRVEHWANALNQGTTAGRNVAGQRGVYDRLPYFFSDQYDLGMEYVGLGDPSDALVVRGDLDAREFVAFWHREGVVTAAMNVNVWDVVDDLKTIVAAGRPADLDRLADRSVALGEVVGASSG